MRKGLGARLHDSRIATGVSVEELAATTQYPAPYIALAERGRVRMLPRHYRALIKVLDSLSAETPIQAEQHYIVAQVFAPTESQGVGARGL